VHLLFYRIGTIFVWKVFKHCGRVFKESGRNKLLGPGDRLNIFWFRKQKEKLDLNTMRWHLLIVQPVIYLFTYRTEVRSAT
jgi:hypothetical protein